MYNPKASNHKMNKPKWKKSPVSKHYNKLLFAFIEHDVQFFFPTAKKKDFLCTLCVKKNLKKFALYISCAVLGHSVMSNSF